MKLSDRLADEAWLETQDEETIEQLVELCSLCETYSYELSGLIKFMESSLKDYHPTLVFNELIVQRVQRILKFVSEILEISLSESDYFQGAQSDFSAVLEEPFTLENFSEFQKFLKKCQDLFQTYSEII